MTALLLFKYFLVNSFNYLFFSNEELTGPLTIYSGVQYSLGIILQPLQPYHHYRMCYFTDREKNYSCTHGITNI